MREQVAHAGGGHAYGVAVDAAGAAQFGVEVHDAALLGHRVQNAGVVEIAVDQPHRCTERAQRIERFLRTFPVCGDTHVDAGHVFQRLAARMHVHLHVGDRQQHFADVVRDHRT